MTLGLGTAPLGGLFSPVSDEQAHATLEAAWELGIRVFDTAPLYGLGAAEERLGRFLRTKPRDGFVLSTKVGRLIRPASDASAHDVSAWVDNTDRVPVFDFAYDGVMRSFDESLARLGLDRVDILFIHDPDEHFDEAMRGAYPALERSRSEGVVKEIGVGMNQVEMLSRFAREGDFDRFLVAGRYTLLEQPALDELLPLCVEKGIRVTAGGVFNSGLLADPRPGITYNYEAAAPELIERARVLSTICERHGTSLKAAALQFPLLHEAVDTVLTGVRTPEEIAENVRLASEEIPSELWRELGVT
ncbi:MAG: aldo/keto reductase [Actinomycetota bacterium]